ncbi:Glycosyltransferase involved in cell wall bisynthesis [Oceanobacillus limi]|uniref:Glycosyltransferase involved in cell wall bisynthesis n=1 Tax=Oceanobacillus limi TaxID=930131 RepID=A0A1I0H0R2_9BACI|nr:glycosyltransferase family 1 protein [Oceanobacillus limi]SET77068.1 Glycosyltransferase involved in cell wall bisynthesis [Oceanobacillus limi]
MISITEKCLTIIGCKNIEEAKKILKALPKSDESAIFFIIKSIIELDKGNVEGAWFWCWRGLEIHTNNINLLLCITVINVQMGRKEKAFHYFNKYKSLVRNPIKFEELNELSPNKTACNPKILQGTMEIANQMNTIAKGTSKLEMDNNTLNYYPAYLDYPSDLIWPIAQENDRSKLELQLKRLSNQLIQLYDLFHFHFGTSLTLDHSDLDLIKVQQKKVIMHHWGSDVRMLSKAIRTNPYAKTKIRREDLIVQKLSFLSNKISHCIVADEEMYQYVKDFYEHVYIVPLMIDLSLYYPLPKVTKNKLTIVHAPTSPNIKGTPFILEAISKLKERYDFNFILVQGKSHKEAKQIYQEADLIIDQLHIGSYGLLAVEAMAIGKPVMGWISPYMKEKYPDDLPLLIANPETIRSQLEYVLTNQDLLPIIGKQSRFYVEKYHDMKQNSKQIAQIYTNLLNGTDI